MRKNSRNARGARCAGFTLLEVLVALGLLGLVLVALMGGLRFGVRAWEAQEVQQARAADTEAVHALLRRLVARARPLPFVRDSSSGAALYLAGNPETVSFVSELPAALGQGGPYDVVLRRTEDGRLILRWRPHIRAAQGSAAIPYEETELMRGVTALAIRYFIPAVSDRSPGWIDTWRVPATLPALVEFRLRFARDDRRHWTDLVVAPLLGALWG